MVERAPSTRKRKPAANKREAPPQAIGRDRPHITIEPEPLAEFNESTNILIHGNSGVGKTVLAGGAPNAVYLTTEKGVVSAQRTGSAAEIVRAFDWEHVEAGIDWADKEMGPDDWLILDSATKMQELMIRWILRELAADNEARDIDIPQIQDHQKWQQMYKRMIDRVVDGPYNSILVTTSMIREDPEGESLVLPAITGKDYTISNYVSAQMDCVFYYAVGKITHRDDPAIRYLLTETHPPYFAKNRFHGIFPRWLEVEPEDFAAMARVIDCINTGKEWE